MSLAVGVKAVGWMVKASGQVSLVDMFVMRGLGVSISGSKWYKVGATAGVPKRWTSSWHWNAWLCSSSSMSTMLCAATSCSDSMSPCGRDWVGSSHQVSVGGQLQVRRSVRRLQQCLITFRRPYSRANHPSYLPDQTTSSACPAAKDGRLSGKYLQPSLCA